MATCEFTLMVVCITWMSIGVNDAKGDSYSEH